jgi:flagellar assembly protein FliH|tara:strand:- start:11 stop:637 length:627 start_codon:yes stop_codon:yes gene_type:complete
MSQAKKWQAPDMTAGPDKVIRHRDVVADSSQEQSRSIPTANEIEQWRKDAQDEGYQEGLKIASTKSIEIQNRLLQLINFLEHPIKSLNKEVEQQLSQVAVSLAQQLVKRELKIEPGEIIGLIRDLVELLPGNARAIRIFLHPEDAVLVREALLIEADNEEQSWKLIEDAMITPGGCKIKSESSNINATLENRLAALASLVLGGNREED